MTTILTQKGTQGVAAVTFNRPEKGNAFDGEMLKELADCFADLRDDTSVRIVVLRANGRHFCTGADVSGTKRESAITLRSVLAQLDTFPKPVIGIVQGGCVGGGLGFIACCDVVIALEDAFFMVPELRIGITPSRQLTGLLARALGVRALRYYGLSGERMPAHEALRLGLVHDVLKAEDLEERLDALSDLFLRNAPGALSEFKRTLIEFEMPSSDFLKLEEEAPTHGLERSDEAVEGLAAFREKRKPSWYVGR